MLVSLPEPHEPRTGQSAGMVCRIVPSRGLKPDKRLSADTPEDSQVHVRGRAKALGQPGMSKAWPGVSEPRLGEVGWGVLQVTGLNVAPPWGM